MHNAPKWSQMVKRVLFFDEEKICNLFNRLMPGGNKRSYILKQTCR